jgi:hypothetical protein
LCYYLFNLKYRPSVSGGTLWNSSVSHSCWIPVSHVIMQFHCLTQLWNSSDFSDCGSLGLHMAVNYSVAYGYKISIPHGYEISVSPMVVKFLCRTWVWYFGVTHGCGIPVSHKNMVFQCLTLLSRSFFYIR